MENGAIIGNGDREMTGAQALKENPGDAISLVKGSQEGHFERMSYIESGDRFDDWNGIVRASLFDVLEYGVVQEGIPDFFP